MDVYSPLQPLARAAGAALHPFGFAINGGIALRAHGLVNRPHADLDFAASSLAPGELEKVAMVLGDALRGRGAIPMEVSRGDTWRRYAVEFREFPTCIDIAVVPQFEAPLLSADWGFVYGEADAVCHKVHALHDRAASQDFDDYDRIMQSSRWNATRVVEEVEARGLPIDFVHLRDQLARGGSRFAEYAAAYQVD